MKTKIFAILFLGAAVLFGTKAEALSMVPPPYTGAVCTFTRDLTPGTWGEDVRCLQQYLSTTGISYGGYSGGYLIADGYFGPMTTQSVIQWQSRNGLAATGYFDAASRAKYSQLVGYGYGGGDYFGNGNLEEQEVLEIMLTINDALWVIEDTEDELDDSRNNNDEEAEDLIEDAKDDIYESLRALFVSYNISKARNLANDALDNAEEAFDEAGGNRNGGDKGDAQDAIEDAEDAIDDAEDEIADARRRGVSLTLINRAEDMLDDAKDKLDDADDEYDDKDYDDAEDSARDAEELAEDAIDEVN
ncbi:MAG: peptidoglycan-binding protein [bacterium]|nr:peptidoglycan-binding protein [bacterium]